MFALILIMSLLGYFSVGLVVGTVAKIRSKEKAIQKEYKDLAYNYRNSDDKARLARAIDVVENSEYIKTDINSALGFGIILWPGFVIAFMGKSIVTNLETKISNKVLPKDNLTHRFLQIEEIEKIRKKNDELIKIARSAGIDTTYLGNGNYIE